MAKQERRDEGEQPTLDPTDALTAVDSARKAREKAESRERKAVESARMAGVSWARIGQLYGLTKQGAQQRFKASPAESEGEQPRD